MGFHDSFRAETHRLIAASMDTHSTREQLLVAFIRFTQMLEEHEDNEQQWLYPHIEANFHTHVQGLIDEHKHVKARLADVRTCLEDANSTRAAMRNCLIELERTLHSHLATEESMCVPVLLDMNAETFASLMGE